MWLDFQALFPHPNLLSPQFLWSFTQVRYLLNLIYRILLSIESQWEVSKTHNVLLVYV